MIIKKTLLYLKKNGLKKTLKKIWERLSGKQPEVPVAAPTLINVENFYKFVCERTETPFCRGDYEKAKDGPIILNWIVPEMGVGSGGHINIFRFVSMLQERGIHNRIYVDRKINILTDEELRAFLRANYGLDPDVIEMYVDVSEMKFAHGVVATGWQTAYFANRFHNTISKFYFVQDFEPYFYATGSEYIFAENTYKFGFRGITAGDWLKRKLSSEYGMKTDSCGFSYDKELYKAGEKKDDKHRIFFYARPVTPRRAFEIGLLALIELHRRVPDLEVIFAGWDISNYDIPFVHLNAGIVKLSELSSVYSQCDMCLVISCTNLSLLPLEVMASNSVVVSNKGDFNEWLLNDSNSILTECDPLAIADTLEYYFKHPDELSTIRKSGLEFAHRTTWEEQGEKCYKAVVDGIEEDKKSKQL